MENKKKQFRILSLDGGGIRGVITATWLTELEERLKRPLREVFELVAGTSTGSVLACAVAHGIPAKDILNLYVNNGREVFPPAVARRWDRMVRMFTQGVSAPKYDPKGLEKNLRRQFGDDLTLKDLPMQVIVVTYNTLGRQALVLKNTKAEHKDLLVWEVCMASSAAPTYFPGHPLTIKGVTLPVIDGGVVANNPTACAIAGAVRLNPKAKEENHVALDQFVVASFGTGELTRSITLKDTQKWGLIEWAANGLIDVLFDGSADAVDYIANQLTGPGRYFRFQTRLEEGYDDMDDASATNINALRARALDHLATADGSAKFENLVNALT